MLRATRRGRWAWCMPMLAAGLAWTAIGCIPPESFRAVKEPRQGLVLNQRVAIVYSKHYQIDLGGLEGLHSFDIHKYGKIYLKLNTDGLLRPEDVFVPEQVTREQIRLVQSEAFLDSLKSSATVARYLEAPIVAAAPAAAIDAGLLRSFRYATGGTILAARQALRHGIAINIAGGFHHAKPDAGEGFNVYADMPIAIRVLQKEGLIERALVIDLDVHQGNGTIVCTAGDDSVFAFSMHEGDIYPVPKEVGDLDVPLSAGTDDKTYNDILARYLPVLFQRTTPDIVFLQAGCDTLAGDPLARLKMTPAGIVTRDAMVIDECVRRKIPIVMVLGGGYSPNAWEAQYRSIARTIRTYGMARSTPPHPERNATAKERFYTR